MNYLALDIKFSKSEQFLSLRQTHHIAHVKVVLTNVVTYLILVMQTFCTNDIV